MVYFCRFCRCWYFICGIIREVNRFMCILLMKNQLECCLLVLRIKYLFLHVLAQWYYFSKSYCSRIPPILCLITFPVNCHMIKISKLFDILIFKNGF